MNYLIIALVVFLLSVFAGILFRQILKISNVWEGEELLPPESWKRANSEFKSRVFVWGPIASGKTWLIDSFIRKVNLIEDALSYQAYSEDGTELWIEDSSGIRVTKYSLDSGPTTNIEFDEYTIHRVSPGIGQHQACRIQALDGPGGWVTGQVGLASNIQEDDGSDLSYKMALQDADSLLVIVNSGYMGMTASDQDYSLSHFDPSLAGAQFEHALDTLLSSSRKKNQKVFLCFTKSDEHGQGMAGEEFMFGRLFGIHSRSISRKLDSLGKNAPVFFVSAVGFFHDPIETNGRSQPNFDPANNKLIREKLWIPENVELPFFEILDDLNQQTIMENTFPKGKLRKYPPFSWIHNILVGHRIDEYEKYSYKSLANRTRRIIHKWIYA